MFVPVACLKCGKAFQVPPASAGADVACPWCRETTPALPVAGLAPTASELPPDNRLIPVEPLSLDEDPPAPRPPFRFPFKAAGIGLLLMAVVSAVTVAVLGYGAGRMPPSAWIAFTPPDGSCTVALPGQPTEEHLRPNPASGATRGGERYVYTGWYSRVSVGIGWQNLDSAWAKQVEMDRDGAISAPVLTAERDRRKDQVRGKIVKEGTVRFGPYIGLQVVMDTPRGQLVERYIVAADGPQPRLYFLGVEGQNVTAEGFAAQRLFDSFQVNK